MGNVQSRHIEQALAKKHGNREFFLTQCKTGATGKGMMQFDGLAIHKSWAYPCIIGYEIKVSRSDFLKDAKYTNYMPYCHELYFVTPAGMVQRHEIEDSIGLMWYNESTKRLTTKKKALHRKIEISADMLLYVIMTRLESDRLPFHETKADYWRDWLEMKISNRDLAMRVNSSLLKQINELEAENKRYRNFQDVRDKLEQIYRVMDNHGLSTWRNTAETLDKALSSSYPPKLDEIRSKLEDCLIDIQEIKRGQGQ